MNAACPLFQVTENLKLLPLFRPLENVNVRFDISRELVALQFLGDYSVMKLRFYRNRRRHVTVNEMINEMFGLGVFPLLRMNRERFFAERIRVALAELRKLDFLQ